MLEVFFDTALLFTSIERTTWEAIPLPGVEFAR